MAANARDLALFNMAGDSRLRGCDLVGLCVRDVFAAGRVEERASTIQSKTGKSVRFEITETKRLSLERWMRDPEIIGPEFLWPSRIHGSPHLSTQQYARPVTGWVTSMGLEPSAYATHSMRRTTVAQIHKKTGTSAQSFCVWDLRRWTAQHGISASTSRTPTLSEGIDL